MIIANTVKDLMAAVHLAADGSQVDSGIIFCVARLESDDADNGKFWDANDDTWQVAPVAWPEATYSKAAQWIFALPAAASNGKINDSTHYTMTDDLDESAATTVCGGGEHRINAENPLTTADLTNLDVAVSTRATPAQVTTAETNIRGTDSDTLKTLSDTLDTGLDVAVSTRATIADVHVYESEPNRK